MKRYIIKRIITTTVMLSLLMSSILMTSCGATTASKITTTSKNNAAVATPSYCTVTEVFDWGPAVTKLIVNLGKTIKKDSVGTDTFNVHVVRTDPRPNVRITGADAEGDRPVTKAYVSDKDGDAASSGNYVVLEMKIGPDVGLGYPIYYDSENSRNNSWIKCDYTITQKKDIDSDSGTISGLTVSKKSKDIRKLVDDFKTGRYTYANSTDNVILTYASYAPAMDNRKNPLIVWLHGTGEIGTDPTMPITANKSCYFASPSMQSYFGGAYILSPQCQTMWMEGSTENALMALIKNYVSKNSDIDTTRIYVGGNSNGGYMTMLLACDYTSYFAAAMPTCEALSDKSITDEDIQKIKNIPIWFTAAKTDTIVPPADYVIPTYNRLVKAGAKDVHFSYFDNVVDTTGLYKKADGTPYEYSGHFSFYYVFNNQCTDIINGKKTTIMQWLAAQDNSKEPQ